MTTRVVNLRASTYDVYIGRAGRGQDGYFGNPVKIGEQCPVCCEVHRTGGSTLPCFKVYMVQRLRRDAEYRRRVYAMQGETLGCFCKPKDCHGDVYAAFLDDLTHDELLHDRMPLRRRAHAPEKASVVRSARAGASSRDALASVVAARAQAPQSRDRRGDLYVISGHEDDPYELWRVTPETVVLRAVRQVSAFLILREPPTSGQWVTRDQWERRSEWRKPPPPLMTAAGE